MGHDLDLAETDFVARRENPLLYIPPLLIKKNQHFKKSPGTEEVTAHYTLAMKETSQDRLR